MINSYGNNLRCKECGSGHTVKKPSCQKELSGPEAKTDNSRKVTGQFTGQ